MARINYDQIDEISSGGGNSFFTLKNDMDTAVVRFLYETEDELDIYAVHEVELDGKKRYVECIGVGDDPKPCPLCEAGNYRRVKMFLQVVEDGEVKTWERGKKFVPKIIGLFNKYGKDRNGKYTGGLVNREYEIERHGKPGDTQTTYEIYALDKDDKKVEDFPEKQELLGTFILQKNAEEMVEYLETGNFPFTDSYDSSTESGGGSKERSSRRSGSSSKSSARSERRRRVPADEEEVF